MLIPIVCLLLLMAGLVCFLAAAFRPIAPPRPQLELIGFACWIACEIITRAAALGH